MAVAHAHTLTYTYPYQKSLQLAFIFYKTKTYYNIYYTYIYLFLTVREIVDRDIDSRPDYFRLLLSDVACPCLQDLSSTSGSCACARCSAIAITRKHDTRDVYTTPRNHERTRARKRVLQTSTAYSLKASPSRTNQGKFFRSSPVQKGCGHLQLSLFRSYSSGYRREAQVRSHVSAGQTTSFGSIGFFSPCLQRWQPSSPGVQHVRCGSMPSEPRACRVPGGGEVR